MQDKTILIVDDSPINLTLLDRLLRTATYQVQLAHNGETALEKLQNTSVDLVLLDIRLPDIDGYAVCRILKANPTTQHIPVIFLSALNEPLDKLTAFESGGVDYVAKPFHDIEVLARVKTHLQLNSLQQHLEKEIAHRMAELYEANTALEKALAAKKDFLALMGHEFRTPLNSILGVAELLKGESQDLQLKYAKMLEESGLRLLNLVKNILQATQQGIANLEKETNQLQILDVKQLCETSVYSIAKLAEQKQIAITLQISALPFLTLSTTHSRLAQIIGNILDNAVKFTPMQGQIGIRAAYLEETERLIIEVWDTATAIPEREHKRIFEPFVQLEPLLSRSNEGPGLGLTLARNLVELHGGKIELILPKEGGNLFRIYLPAQIAHENAEQTLQTTNNQTTMQKASLSQLTAEQRSTLKELLQQGLISEIIHYLRDLTHKSDCPHAAHELLSVAESFDMQAIKHRLNA